MERSSETMKGGKKFDGIWGWKKLTETIPVRCPIPCYGNCKETRWGAMIRGRPELKEVDRSLLRQKKIQVARKNCTPYFFSPNDFLGPQFFFSILQKIFWTSRGFENAKTPSKFLTPITPQSIFRYQCYFAGDTSLQQCLSHESNFFISAVYQTEY